jgi:hypothetical protein
LALALARERLREPALAPEWLESPANQPDIAAGSDSSREDLGNSSRPERPVAPVPPGPGPEVPDRGRPGPDRKTRHHRPPTTSPRAHRAKRASRLRDANNPARNAGQICARTAHHRAMAHRDPACHATDRQPFQAGPAPE